MLSLTDKNDPDNDGNDTGKVNKAESFIEEVKGSYGNQNVGDTLHGVYHGEFFEGKYFDPNQCCRSKDEDTSIEPGIVEITEEKRQISMCLYEKATFFKEDLPERHECDLKRQEKNKLCGHRRDIQ